MTVIGANSKEKGNRKMNPVTYLEMEFELTIKNWDEPIPTGPMFNLIDEHECYLNDANDCIWDRSVDASRWPIPFDENDLDNGLADIYGNVVTEL